MASEGARIFSEIIANTAIASSVAPLLFILSIKTRTYFTLKWVLFILIGLGLIIDLMLKSPKITFNYNILYNVYTIICISTSIVLYSNLLSTSFSRRLSIYSLSIVLITFISRSIYMNDFKIDSSITYMLYSIIVVILSFFFFRTLLNEMKVTKLLRHPPFWIVFAFLMYYGGTMSLTLFQDYIIGGGLEITIILWPIQGIANIIFSILISISVWTMRKT